MGTTPPSSSSRHHRYRWIGWRSRSFYPPPWKNKTHGSHPPLQQCAPSPVLQQVDGRPRPVFEGIGGRPPITGFEPAPSRRAPGALPPGRLPSEIHWHPGHRTNAPATPSPCAKCKPAVGVLCWAMNRNIGAPLQPRSHQPPLATRRAKLRAHRARHGIPADRRLDTKSTPLPPPAGTERGPHNRTPAPTARAPTAHPVDGQSGEEERKTPNAPRNGRRHPPRGRPAAAPTTPSQVGGNRDRTAPPQARRTEHGTGAGHAEGHGPRGTALPAPSAGTTRDARATPPSGERTPRERERTHTKRTRRDYRKGNQTERAERTDRMEWRTSERG